MQVLRFLWLLLASPPFFNVGAEVGVKKISKSENLDTLWSSIPVYEHLAASASNQCRTHTRNMLDSLRNATFWAVQMVDASANVPSGLLEGNIYNFGDFDECLSIDTGTIQGQYCLASIRVDGPKLEGLRARPIHDARQRPDPFLNAWHHIQNRGERWRASRDTLKMAICVPKSCSYLEVQEATLAAYNSKMSIFNIAVEVDLPESLCSTHEPVVISLLDILFVFTIGLLTITVAFATLYNYLLQRREKPKTQTIAEKMILCFDLRKNFLGLANMEAEGESDLNFLFGIRLFAILKMVSSHKIAYTTGGPTKNPNFQEQEYSKFTFMPLMHGDLVVDTFFFLGGFLLVVGLLKDQYISGSKLNVSLRRLYLFRFLRIAPAYIITILFYVSIFPKIGSGPLWKVTVVPESDFCVENWWTNLAFINNYVNVDRYCIQQSWYIPCDMHLFIVSAPLVILLHRRPKMGISVLILIIFASIIAPLFAFWMADADPMLFFFIDLLRNPRAHTYYTFLYVKSHLRGSPYFIGLLFGYIYIRKRNTKWEQGKSVLLLLVGFLIAAITSYSAALFYHTEGVVSTSALARALYGALHRPIWALATGIIVLAISQGRLNMMKTLLGWKPMVPLSKLAYGAFLVHLIVLWYSAGTIREPSYYNLFNYVAKVLGDLTITFIIALVLYLLVEAPIRDIGKLSAKTSKEETKIEECHLKMN